MVQTLHEGEIYSTLFREYYWHVFSLDKGLCRIRVTRLNGSRFLDFDQIVTEFVIKFGLTCWPTPPCSAFCEIFPGIKSIWS